RVRNFPTRCPARRPAETGVFQVSFATLEDANGLTFRYAFALWPGPAIRRVRPRIDYPVCAPKKLVPCTISDSDVVGCSNFYNLKSRTCRTQMSASNFAAVPLAPRDPILGLTEAYLADERPDKVNLGVGVYYDDSGKVPVLAAVAEAERRRVASSPARGYLPIEGFAEYNKAVQHLLFGADSTLLAANRVATFECLGGTGALRVGADFLRGLGDQAKVLISVPSWENHRAIFQAAGFEVQVYPYYDPQTHGVRFDEMLAAIEAASPGDIVVLHACCHNPTGVDIDAAQWSRVVEACARVGVVPFLDMAYQGFGDGIEQDAIALRLFAASGQNLLVASSFSKN